MAGVAAAAVALAPRQGGSDRTETGQVAIKPIAERASDAALADVWLSGAAGGDDARTTREREHAAIWSGYGRLYVPERMADSTRSGAPLALQHMPLGEGVIDGEVTRLICSYAWPCSEALAVAGCESGFDPGAVSPDGQNIGIFQVNLVHGYFPGLAENVAKAYEIWSDQGWSPWACNP